MNREELNKALDNALGIINSFGPLRINKSENIIIGKYNLFKAYAGNQLISGDFTIVKEIENKLGFLSTFAYLIPEGLVRISTSLKDGNGNYVIGTLTDNNHPISISIRNGKKALGREWITNDFFETGDIPVFDDSGNIIMSFGLGFRETTGEREIILFSLCGQMYAMNIMFISEVSRLPENIITSSGNNKNILGLYTLKEEVIPIIDTLKVFGHDSIQYSDFILKDMKMIILQIEDKKYSLLVDKVYGLGRYSLKDLERIKISDQNLTTTNITDGILPMVRNFSDVPVILGDKLIKAIAEKED
jgi:chemotaxis signal transduction protein